ALREIQKYQKMDGRLLLTASFRRIIRTVTIELFTEARGIRFAAQALECIQDAAEAYLVTLMEDANRVAIHAKRVTLFPTDIRLVNYLR
ncbi:histone-fold-containing protein, partial [Obelidium mucronatum]